MSDIIHLDQHFPISPLVAAKEAKRCQQIADHFAAKADNPYDLHRDGAAVLRDEYRARAKRLRQIAQPTAPRLSDMAV